MRRGRSCRDSNSTSAADCRRRPRSSRQIQRCFRQSGFAVGKGATIRSIAERFADGRLSDEALSRMTDEEVVATLTEIPGIDPRTANGFLLVALDRQDVFLLGDIALRRAIQRAYGFDHVPSADEMIEVSDRWRPFRSLPLSYLFAFEYDG